MRKIPPHARTARLNINNRKYLFPESTSRAAALIMKGKNISYYSVDSLKSISEYLTRFKEDVIKSQDYMYAQAIEDKINEINLHCTKTTYEMQQETTYDQLRAKMQIAKDELKEAKLTKQTFIEQFNQQREKAVENLLLAQQNEMENFEDEVNRYIYRYNKYSRDLLNRRNKEQNMVLAGLFIEAYWTKKDADALQIQEDDQIHKNWNSFVEHKRDSLMKYHQAQMQCLIEKFEKNYIASIRHLDSDIKRYRNAVHSLKTKVSTAESYNSPGSRRVTQGIILPIPDQNLSARMTRMRTSNYTLRRDNRRSAMNSSRIRNSMY
ncbi:hypothetical protein TRFO_01680 [Tritrichomonas foetus]|uniref:Uncharacterized protein n=1 Tax=Tritrichomonas foetus TaxID=1144522 RepID=A0A1J4JUA2_9EUKA|nr:hypothetical protein TRFO_01680 [Tritrichomonas foetus]|eukprot:OHT01102.1 hypothetical protein TRFO_01680 [Tritrichomonas foetus]